MILSAASCLDPGGIAYMETYVQLPLLPHYPHDFLKCGLISSQSRVTTKVWKTDGYIRRQIRSPECALQIEIYGWALKHTGLRRRRKTAAVEGDLPFVHPLLHFANLLSKSVLCKVVNRWVYVRSYLLFCVVSARQPQKLEQRYWMNNISTKT